ncbi:5-hydroxytryptamine receptor 1D [Clarias magur]|uniref:5-hydroxytryptamine receptor 1D n=1 Tax=Clarias magur TaxID=1594786 RepID=A0A8J4TX14_CLAMG|nr:5-hydroxytryptamine receptor 1D [Clarias magur]
MTPNSTNWELKERSRRTALPTANATDTPSVYGPRTLITLGGWRPGEICHPSLGLEPSEDKFDKWMVKANSTHYCTGV